ncbi:hypothetical protein HD806DRAFT_39149 [Xylariaceae sp. AK1471]|nr:hypothetical protein HD806DRAFT_39149 [Xylariaceae sp. AK1471]
MFSSGSASANFKGLRRKTPNDGSSSTLHTARPSTATSPDRHYSYGLTDLLEPALDGPPSPEGIRAFSRRMKRGSILEQQNELATSSGSSSLRSETLETQWERHLDGFGLSRNPSQRSSGMSFKERHESVQLFGKAVFGRKPKPRREQNDQGFPTSSLLSLTEMPKDAAPDQPKEQRFMQMFTRRRPRGASEASQRKYQISGPYDFQHVSHSAKGSWSGFDHVNHQELPSGFSGARPRTTTDASNTSSGLTSQTLDKPLPTPPSPQRELGRVSLRDSIQFSPPRPPRFISDAQTSPISPPPRTSSRVSVRHDHSDSFGVTTFEKVGTNSIYQQAQPFILPSTDGLWLPPVSYVSNGQSEEDGASGDEKSFYPVSTVDATAWPLTSSMTSLPEVPEEEEYHLTTIQSRTSIMSNTTSLRGSVSVPYLRRVSLSQSTQRPPSNASDTLGRFDLLAAQRALRDSNYEDMDDDDFIRDTWEDDIDYCYDHAAEADCDFSWERPSCDLDREDFYEECLAPGHRIETSCSGFGPAPMAIVSTDLPGLSPMSYESKATQHEATTPTSSTMLVASNFSLPRIDSSTQLKRDHDRSHSSASSFQEVQGFCLSPSLLIPDDYHEKMLQYERGELCSNASTEELKISEHDDQYLKFDKPGAFLHARSSASTTLSTLSEQSMTSSRYPSSTFSSSAFTRWTGSSSSSWQHVESSQQPVAITLNDKETVVTSTSGITVVKPGEPPVSPLQQDLGREGHSRAQSEATLLLKTSHDTVTPLDPEITKESLKTHRRARTASRSHTTSSPQFALFPQVPQRP